MKPIINFIFIVLLSCTQLSVAKAQEKTKKTKQIEAIKFGYISGRLNLTEEESREFWPLYKEYQAEWNDLMRQKRQLRMQNNNAPEKAVDDDLNIDEKLLNLKKHYRVAFGRVLPPEKLKKLYQAERDFREELIKQLKNR